MADQNIFRRLSFTESEIIILSPDMLIHIALVLCSLRLYTPDRLKCLFFFVHLLDKFGRRIFAFYFHLVLLHSPIMFIVVACSSLTLVLCREASATTTAPAAAAPSTVASLRMYMNRLCKCINRTTTLSLFFYADLVCVEFAVICFGM